MGAARGGGRRWQSLIDLLVFFAKPLLSTSVANSALRGPSGWSGKAKSCMAVRTVAASSGPPISHMKAPGTPGMALRETNESNCDTRSSTSCLPGNHGEWPGSGTGEGRTTPNWGEETMRATDKISDHPGAWI